MLLRGKTWRGLVSNATTSMSAQEPKDIHILIFNLIYSYTGFFIPLTLYGVSPGARKKQRLEDLTQSRTVSKFADLIGRGQLSIAAAADIARSVVSHLNLYLCFSISKKAVRNAFEFESICFA